MLHKNKACRIHTYVLPQKNLKDDFDLPWQFDFRFLIEYIECAFKSIKNKIVGLYAYKRAFSSARLKSETM